MSSESICTCTFCNKKFSNKSNLLYHQKTAKFCLDIQGKSNDEIICFDCDKTFVSQYTYNKHSQICKQKNNLELIKTELEKLRTENLIFQKEIFEKDKMIEEYKNKVEKLENHLMKLSERPTNTTNNTTHNNQRYNQIIQNLVPITDEHFEEISEQLTAEHIAKGVQGYAELTCYLLQGKAVCTDISRKVLKHKNQKGEIICDPKMENIAIKFFTSISQKNKQLYKECVDDLTKQLKENLKKISELTDEDVMNESELCVSLSKQHDEISDTIDEFRYNRNDIEEIIKGKDNTFKNKYIDKVCTKLYVKQADPINS
jgi:hypothetical protein